MDDVKRLAFTGTHEGMTLAQRHAFARFIMEEQPDEFHHGVCEGADEQAHLIVRALLPDCLIVGHPGVRSDGNRWKRSLNAELDCDELMLPKEFMDRNDDLAGFDFIVGTPEGFAERQRSGTWATIRRARRRETPEIIFYPNGRTWAK